MARYRRFVVVGSVTALVAVASADRGDGVASRPESRPESRTESGLVSDAGTDVVATPAGAGECETCTGDIDLDCVVGYTDLMHLLGNFGECGGGCSECPADLNGDCDVDFDDLIMLLPRWGPCTAVFISRCDEACDGEFIEYEEIVAADSDLVLWDFNLKSHVGIHDLGNAIDRIHTKRSYWPSDISVFYVGYGCTGRISMGSGREPGDDRPHRDATELTLNNAAWFADQIKDDVTVITLWSCNTARDAKMMEAMSSDELRVCAFKKRVIDTLTDGRPYYFSEYRLEKGGMACFP